MTSRSVDDVIDALRQQGLKVHLYPNWSPVMAAAGSLDSWTFGEGASVLEALLDLERKIRK